VSQRRPEPAADLPAALRIEALSKSGWVDREFATRWLAEHWKDRTCPACRCNDWGMLEQLVQMPVGARIPIAPQEFPCVLVACRNCGHAMLFSAVRMGVVPRNVYLVSRSQMAQVATTSRRGVVWWSLAALAAGLAIAFSVSGITAAKPLKAHEALLFEILPLGFLVLFAIALIAILVERRRRTSLLSEIEEDSRVPTESQFEPLQAPLDRA
jgi:RNase P subunit RPR2